MEKFLGKRPPEIIFGSSESKISQAIRRAVKAGRLIKIAPKIYTSNLSDTPEAIISRHRYYILGQLFPNAVISHRSALEGGFAQDNSIVLTYKYTKNIKLPGLFIRLVEGSGPLKGDTDFLNGLYIASRARAFLENLQISRGRIAVPKTLTKKELERRLDNLVRVHGAEALNRLRDEAKPLAQSMQLQKELKQFDLMVSALLGTHDATMQISLSSFIRDMQALKTFVHQS